MSNQHKLQLMSTHSSTQMTQHTETSDTTQMLPSMLQATPTPNRLPVFPPVLTALEPTPSSTHTTPATSLAMSSPSSLLQDLSSNNSNSPASTTTTITTTPHRVQADSFLQEN